MREKKTSSFRLFFCFVSWPPPSWKLARKRPVCAQSWRVPNDWSPTLLLRGPATLALVGGRWKRTVVPSLIRASTINGPGIPSGPGSADRPLPTSSPPPEIHGDVQFGVDRTATGNRWTQKILAYLGTCVSSTPLKWPVVRRDAMVRQGHRRLESFGVRNNTPRGVAEGCAR